MESACFSKSSLFVFLLFLLLLTACANVNAPEYGTLNLELDWSQSGSESRSFTVSSAASAWPDGMQRLRVTVMPGDLIFEFEQEQAVYSLSLELGIYNILIEGLDGEGLVLFSSLQEKVLVKPSESTDLTLPMECNYPTGSPRFIDTPVGGRIDSSRFTLSWTGIDRATRYRLQESSTEEFSDSVTVYLGSDTLWTCEDHEGGSFVFRVRAEHDIQNSQWSEPLHLWIDLTPPLSIQTDSLPAVQVRTDYSFQFKAEGGTTPYTWSQIGGNLPSGIELTTEGILSGIARQTGSFTFTVRVQDAGDPVKSAEETFTLEVLEQPPPLAFLTDTLAVAHVGDNYECLVSVTGGVLPYTDWNLSSDAPFDLNLEPLESNEALITAVPTVAGDFSLEIRVSDSATPSQQVARTFTLHVLESVPPVVILTDTLVPGRVGQPYEAILEASGGILPYSEWQVSSTAPFDLSIASHSDDQALLSGLPTQAGLFQVDVSVRDSHDPSQYTETRFWLDILPALAPFAIVTDTLPEAQAGIPLNAVVQAAGGHRPYHSWSVTHDCPFDIAIESRTDSSAEVMCIPTEAGVFELDIQVLDSSDPVQSAEKTLSLAVSSESIPLAIATDALRSGEVNVAFQDTVTGEGGRPPYAWQITHDAPFEISLTALNDSAAVLSCLPTQADTFDLTLELSDSNSPPETVQRSCSWVVQPSANGVQITTDSFPDAYSGQTYKQWVLAQGGTLPYSWSIVQSDDPDMTIVANDPERGVLMFTPETTGEIDFVIRVQDSSDPVQTNERGYTISVLEGTTPLQITTAGLPDARVREDYSYQLYAEGGVEPYVWEMLAPTYPPDEAEFQLSDTGLLTGNPWEERLLEFHVRVTDSDSPPSSAERWYTMDIKPAWFVIRTASLPDGTVNESYDGFVTAEGGTLPYTWDITGLPPGVSVTAINDGMRQFSGTPTTEGDYSISVQIQDSGTPQQTIEEEYPVHIDPDPDQLHITTPSPLPDAVFGTSYLQDIEATGATPSTRVWDMVDSDTPFDAWIGDPDSDGNGELEFYASSSGTFNLTIAVFDETDAGNSDQKTFQVTVPSPYDPLEITTASPLPDAVYGTSYAAQIDASGGSGLMSRTWELVSTNAPFDVTVETLNGYGMVSFEAFSSGTFTLTIKVTDTTDPGLSDEKQFSVTVPSP